MILESMDWTAGAQRSVAERLVDGRTIRRALAALLGLTVPILAVNRARAFQGEPAAIVSIGLENWRSTATSTAPTIGLGGGYGLSEWTDLRALATASRLNLCREGRPGAGECGDQTWDFSMGGLLALKLDVIQWVPYAGPRLTYHWLTGGPVPSNSHAHDLGIGAAVGIDYVPAREYGIGLQVGYEGFATALVGGAFDRGLLTAGLHFEFRSGW